MSDSRLVTLKIVREGVYEVEKEWDDQAQQWVKVSGEQLFRDDVMKKLDEIAKQQAENGRMLELIESILDSIADGVEMRDAVYRHVKSW